ncbi:hypothetical protein [Burkholderia cenocepacia]|uniref:hypothetical protein n=1 Tax=Burkholderia cenocepacia TaxID=95486 RepID=UPI002654C207|nr:hypothetical protein [Burkholderia cenocepacia]MDN7677860.1 hypothetical protein [Burkholderia cenocepacia]
MKGLLLKLFRCRAEQAPAAEVAAASAPAQKPAPRKPAGKRRYGKRKGRHPAPRGAYKADWNEPILRGDRR